MRVEALDHLVLTVRDVSASVEFYVDVLGTRHGKFGDGRHAVAVYVRDPDGKLVEISNVR